MKFLLLVGLILCQTRFNFCDDVITTAAPQHSKPDVYELHVNTDIKYRYATTVISSRVANPADVAQEVGFTVVLPESAYISGFVMEIEGKEYKAYVKEKEKAKQDYDAAVSQGLGAGYVEQKARDSNQFTVSVNIEPQSKVNFNLTYDQLLNRVLGSYKHVVNINPGQVVRDMSVVVNINESSKLTKIKVPDLKLDNNVVSGDLDKKDNELAVITRNDPYSATVTWAPTPDQQKEIAKDGINGQLTVEYDVDREKVQEILVEDGYFVHFFAPETLQPLPKHVVFVLDYSGSMIGKKIDQLKEAMTTILSDLTAEDYFSLVTFSDYAQPWNPNNMSTVNNSKPFYFGMEPPKIELTKDHIVPVTPEKIALAKEHIKIFNDYGSTNIMDGLRTGLKLTTLGKEVNKNTVQNVEPMIVFLTDGQPNVEVSDTDEIIKKVQELNTDQVAIFSLAFGYGADEKFLKKLSLKNNAFHRVIYEAADADLQLKNFYKEIASPLLSDITFKYVPSQVDEESSTKLKFPSFFNGSEIVVAGKLLPNNKSESGQLTAMGFAGNTSYPILIDCWIPPFPVEENHTASRLEKVWAYLTIQQLLDKTDTITNETEVDLVKKEALDLALKYEFVTPLTSLVVIKPNETSAVNAEQIRPGGAAFGGYGGAGSAGGYASFQHAPMAPMPAMIGYSYRPTSIIATYDALDFSMGLNNYQPRPSVISPPYVRPSPPSQYEPEVLGKGTLDDLPWLYNYTMDNITYTLPLSTGPANFSLGHNQTDEVFYECPIAISSGENGECRHLEHCVLQTFTSSINQYMSYFCDIKIDTTHYIGACCPKSPTSEPDPTPALPQSQLKIPAES